MAAAIEHEKPIAVEAEISVRNKCVRNDGDAESSPFDTEVHLRIILYIIRGGERGMSDVRRPNGLQTNGQFAHSVPEPEALSAIIARVSADQHEGKEAGLVSGISCHGQRQDTTWILSW